MKKCKLETLTENSLRLVKTKILKKRLKYLKKKPKKNKNGIIRIEEELNRRLMEEIDSYLEEQEEVDRLLDEIDREFSNSLESEVAEEKSTLTDEEYSEALKRVREIKICLAHKVNEDPAFVYRLRLNSDKIKVIAEIRYANDKIYGYMIQNISDEILDMEYNDTELEILCPGDLTIIELERFVLMASETEFSFTFSNGLVKSTIPLDEELKMGKEKGLKYILSNYHFVVKGEEEPIPIIYIE